jgi:glutathione S-transferase
LHNAWNFLKNAAGGKVMTESAAILIWLADRYPRCGVGATAQRREASNVPMPI